jgi:hypothetical protein
MRQKVPFIIAMMIAMLFVVNSFSNAQSDSITVPYLNSSLTIDGDDEDWPYTKFEMIPMTHTVNKVEPWIVNGEIHDTSDFPENDLSAEFMLAHDVEYIYIFVEVYDDEPVLSWDRPWKEDCIEVYFNPDLGNDVPFDGTNNYMGSDGMKDAIQMRFPRDTSFRFMPYWIIENWLADTIIDGSDTNVTNEMLATVDPKPTTYTAEARIPLDSLFTNHENIGGEEFIPDGTPLVLRPKEGRTMGFDVMVTDNDGTANTNDDGAYYRDGHLAWANDSGDDDLYLNTHLFGKITLGHNQGGSIGNIMATNILMGPNPVRDNLKIRNLQNFEQVNINNILGNLVLSKDVSNNNNTTIDCSGLASGLYVISFIDNNNNVYTSKLIVK